MNAPFKNPAPHTATEKSSRFYDVADRTPSHIVWRYLLAINFGVLGAFVYVVCHVL